MRAYNYESQEWVEGSEAVSLRINQLVQELILLRGPRGKEYARFSRIDYPEQAVAAMEMELAGLRGEL